MKIISKLKLMKRNRYKILIMRKMCSKVNLLCILRKKIIKMLIVPKMKKLNTKRIKTYKLIINKQLKDH